MRLTKLQRRIVIGLPILIIIVTIALPTAKGQGVFPWQSSEKTEATATNAAGNRNQSANATQSRRHGALFQGQSIQLPKMPFGRSNTPAKNATGNQRVAANPQSAHQQNAQRAAQQQNAQHMAGQMNAAQINGNQLNMATRQAPRQFDAQPSAVPIHSQRTVNPMAARPDQAHQQVNSELPSMPAAQMPRSGRYAAQPQTMLNPNVAAHTAEPPVRQTPRQTPASAAAESSADKVIAQAHATSGAAKTEADFTRLIETCQQTDQSQLSPNMQRYAKELASWAYNRRGQLRADAGREQEALADFNESVNADPNRWRAIHNRGVLMAQSGEFEKAFDDFNRTIDLNPEYAKAYSNRAALYVVAGNFPSAIDDYAQATSLDPNLAVAHRGWARACHLNGQSDDAITHYDEAIRLVPDDAYAIASRADVLTDLGRYAEAVADYDYAIELDPKLAQAYSGSAWLLATCPDSTIRNPGLALERATTAVAMNGNDRAACFDTLAAAQANAGDFGAALATIRQAVQNASPEERTAYQERLHLYQHAKPYRIAPAGQVMQASYETVSE